MPKAFLKSPLVKAVLASFLVYLFPIVGPHAAFTLGPALIMGVAEGLEEQGIPRMAANFALAFTLQAIFGYVVYWFFRKPGWRRALGLAGSVPALFLALQWVMLITIPTFFLIEGDPAPEQTNWEVECEIPDSYLAPINPPPDLQIARAGEAWVARKEDSRLSLLRMPGCNTIPLDLRWSNASPQYGNVITNGRAVFKTHRREDNTWHWWYQGPPGSSPHEIDIPPHTRHEAPLLSSDGNWVAWLQRVPTEGNRTTPRILLRSLTNKEEATIGLNRFAPAAFRLIQFDTDSEEVLLARNTHEFLSVRLDGAVRWGPWRPEGVRAWEHTFRRLDSHNSGKGWVAWDGYEEKREYRIAWSLPTGSGIKTIPKGRAIKSAAVDPGGRYIAVSTDTRYSIGDVKNAVYVFRVSDGQEAYRRYLPPHSRSQVVFLGSGYFAYSEPGKVLVLKIPPESPPTDN